MKRAVRKFNTELDSLEKSSIVKPSDEKTPPDGAANTNQGLTGHAGMSSMAAESYSNLALSSRQLLKPAPLVKPAPDGSFDSRRVEYVPPTEAEVSQYAQDVCAALSEAIPAGRFSEPEVRTGFRQFMMVVVHIVAKQANQKGALWKIEGDPNPPPGQA